jgi:O-antigen/teichoic acid export membrane protein
VVRSCLAVTLAGTAVLAAIILVVGWVFAPALLSRMGDPATIRFILMGAVILLTLEQMDIVFASALRGFERFDLAARAEMVMRAAMVVATLAAAGITRQLLPVILCVIAVTFLRLVLKIIVATRLMAAGLIWPQWDRDRVRSVVDFGKWAWLQAIAAAIFGTADRFLVGGLLGSEALARYSICLQLAQQVQVVPAAASQVLFPAISRKIAAGDPVRAYVIRAFVMVCLLSAALSVPLALLSYPILVLWVGEAIANAAAPTLAILSLSFGILAINSVPHFVLLGFNDSRSVALFNLAAGAIALLACWWAASQFGMAGAAANRAAYAVAMLAMLPVMWRAISTVSLAIKKTV